MAKPDTGTGSAVVPEGNKRLAYLRSLWTQPPEPEPSPAEPSSKVEFSLESLVLYKDRHVLEKELSAASASKRQVVDTSRPAYDGRKRKLFAKSVERVSCLARIRMESVVDCFFYVCTN